jgi:ribonuclease P protein component
VKKAVRRNRIRRQLKEIYRLNNTPLKMALSNQTTGLALFLIYTGEEKVEFALLETKLKLLLLELTTHIEVNGIKTIE